MREIAADAILVPGDVVAGSYEVTELVGRGGMGAVFRARHLRLPGKDVAIKVLLERGGTPEALARFRREAEIASRLGHPNIVSVLDFNALEDGTPYIVMEYLEGESLADRMAMGPMEFANVVEIARQLGSALAAAHLEGIVHRDLKPQNVMLVPNASFRVGQVKVVDFGISKIQGSTTVKTDASRMLGTPQYMAPEQATGDHHLVDERADVFALGTIIYEMLTGEPLYSGTTVHEVVFKVVYSQPPELTTYAAIEIAPAASRAVARAMEKRPADRFERVADLISAFAGESLDDVETVSTSSMQGAFPTPSGAATRFDRPLPALKQPPRDAAPLGARGLVLATAAAVGISLAVLIAAQSDRSEGSGPADTADTLAIGHATAVKARAAGLDALRAGDLAAAAGPLAVAHRAMPDVETATMLRFSMQTLDAYEGPALDGLEDVNDVLFAETRDWILSAHGDGSVRTWDGTTGALLETWRRPGVTTHVVLAHDGKYIAGRYDDGSVTIWEVQTGRRVLDLANLHSESGGFVLDGEHFLTFASTGAFEVWDVPAGKRVLDGKHSGDGENVLMSMSANHRFIATAGDKRISAWNLTSGKRIESTLPPGAQVTHIAYRAAMESAADIYVARADGQLRLTSLPNASGFPIVDLSGSIEYVAEQAGGDNMVVIAGGRGYTMRRSEPTRVRQLPRPVSYGSLSVETGRLTTVSPDGVVSLYSRDLVTLLGTYRVASTAPKKISYNETTGRLLVLADNRVTQWNLSPPLERLTVFGAGEGDSAGIQFSVSGDRALVWSDKAGVAVRLIDVESRKLLAALGPDGSATAERALFDPSGRYAASVAGVFDAKTGQVVCHSRVEADHQLLAQAFDDGYTITTMTGQAFLVAFADCSIMGMTRARRLGTTEYKVPATSAVVTSDGHVTVGYSDGTVIRWERGTLEAARAASEGSPFRLTATGDEKFVLARTGQTMSVWDAQTLELRSNFGPAQSSFRVLGNDRVMAWTNTNVYIWRIPGGEVAMDIPHDVLVDESPIRHDAADGTASYTRSLSIVGMILSADASSDGKIASITNSDIAYVWGPGGERLYKFELPAPATDIRFHPDGNTIAMTSGSDLLFWDVAPESRSSEEIDRLLEERGLAVTP